MFKINKRINFFISYNYAVNILIKSSYKSITFISNKSVFHSTYNNYNNNLNNTFLYNNLIKNNKCFLSYNNNKDKDKYKHFLNLKLDPTKKPTLTQIKMNYKKLARKYHPDIVAHSKNVEKNIELTNKFREITE